MTNLINKFLNTGRQLLTVEQQLQGMPTSHPDRARLSREHSKLQKQQNAEIEKALRSGVDQKTHRIRAIKTWTRCASLIDVLECPLPTFMVEGHSNTRASL